VEALREREKWNGINKNANHTASRWVANLLTDWATVYTTLVAVVFPRVWTRDGGYSSHYLRLPSVGIELHARM
jgi:hypothetical protein